jgi:CMP-N,N'-diacetyllegionaminic acid synthase
MSQDLNILGLIPARGGSQGIPRKNLAPLAGEPLIAHTIKAALAARTLSRVLVSTDDEEIAATARQYGAEVPFLRPGELATDAAPALAVMRHAVQWLVEQEDWPCQVVVYLQPTSPLRRAEHIDAAVELLLAEKADTVVSVVEVPHNMNPLSVMRLSGKELKPFLTQGAQPLRRQDKPRALARNGPAVLALTRQAVMECNELYSCRTLPLVMTPQESVDIDDAWDLDLAQWIMERRKKI